MCAMSGDARGHTTRVQAWLKAIAKGKLWSSRGVRMPNGRDAGPAPKAARTHQRIVKVK
jgi:hypothetical protein